MAARTPQFAHELDGSTGASQIGPARKNFERWLQDHGVTGDAADELVIVFSELAANAVTASPPGSVVQMRSDCDGDEIVLEARNGSPRTTPSPGQTWNLADPLRAGGRGLLIVTAYMDSVQVDPAEDTRGILVRCRRSLARA